MKRELAFALEAGSHFGCFVGRTRSSKSSPAQFTDSRTKITEVSSIDRSVKLIEKEPVNRRSKKVKTSIPDGDSVNVDRFNGSEKSAEAEVAPAADKAVNVEEESAASDVLDGGDETPAVEAAKVEEDGRKSVHKVYVKRKKSKNQVNCITPKRFTRSAMVEKNLDLKLSKKIGLGRMPINMRELLETGLLEGLHVSYDFNTEGKNLQGIIKGIGILCSCNLCEGTKVISASQFEMHACKSYRHAIKHIRLENGKSLLEVIEICKESASESVEVALQSVISSLPVKGPYMCTKCSGLIEPSSAENLLICSSCLNNKQVEAEPSVATRGEVRESTPEPKESESNSSSISFDRKNKRGRKRKSSKSALKSVKRARSCKILPNKKNPKIIERSTRSASVPRSIKSATSSQQGSRIKLTMKNHTMHWHVFQEGGLPDGTELTYFSRGKKQLDGYKLGQGIFCSCCKTVISASQFEAHAGWASHKKPYGNIYISNGLSLHEYAVSLKKTEKQRCPLKFNDDLCGVCRDGGDLLLCDGCPRSFHRGQFCKFDFLNDVSDIKTFGLIK